MTVTPELLDLDSGIPRTVELNSLMYPLIEVDSYPNTELEAISMVYTDVFTDWDGNGNGTETF